MADSIGFAYGLGGDHEGWIALTEHELAALLPSTSFPAASPVGMISSAIPEKGMRSGSVVRARWMVLVVIIVLFVSLGAALVAAVAVTGAW